MLNRGDRIGIVCCSNGLASNEQQTVQSLIKTIEQMGLTPVISDYLYRKDSVFPASARERADILMKFYRDFSVKAIFDISGGDIANEILPYLDFSIIAQSDKQFWGYSDLTTILNGIYSKTGKTGVLYSLKNLVKCEGKNQQKLLLDTLFSPKKSLLDFPYTFIQGETMKGIVIGGNIRCFLKLAGTDYFPDLENKILLLEAMSGDAGKIATYLCQLKMLGAFEKIQGILLGTFTQMQQEKITPDIISLVKEYAGELPIAKTELIGHGADSRGIVIGKYREFHKNLLQQKEVSPIISQSILDYETVRYDEKSNTLVIIDQTKLPGKIQLISLKCAQEIWDAIYLLKVRGAPAIGVAAAYGLALLAKQITAENVTDFWKQLEKQKQFLASSRPTAVNLFWALNRLMKVCEHKRGQLSQSNSHSQAEKINILQESLIQEAHKIKEEDIEVCRKIGENGLTVLNPGDGILTHCNAGQLATCKYGTATAPIYLGQEKGYHFKVYADETRPLLQGARLTAFELYSAGIDVTLACDNMVASLMQQGRIQAVLVGCDRVALNGDTANKIGTSVVAAVAKYYHVPFYVCAPLSTIDCNTKTGSEIVIEQRKPEEVSKMWYQTPMTPDGVKIYNPAFDVTDHSLITGFITEKGVFSSPEEIF